jgi:hypothetical protein
MSVSVNTSNQVSEAILYGGTNIASFALAASVANMPIAFLGGAVYGVIHTVSYISFSWIANHVLNANHPQANEAAKTVSEALKFFGSHAVAWAALAIGGFSLTGVHVIVLMVNSTLACLALAVLLSCCLTPTEPARA